MSAYMYSWWSSYLQALKTKPLRTNTATALVITSCGDILAQTIEKNLASSAPTVTSSTTSSSTGSTTTPSSSAQDVTQDGRVHLHHNSHDNTNQSHVVHHRHNSRDLHNGTINDGKIWIDNNQHQNQHPNIGINTNANDNNNNNNDDALNNNNDNNDNGICWKRNQIVSSYWCLAAPISYYWFRWLDSTFPIPKVNARGLITLSKKLTLHVGVYRTTVNTLFYGWLVWFQQQQQQQQEQQQQPQLDSSSNNDDTHHYQQQNINSQNNSRIQASSPLQQPQTTNTNCNTSTTTTPTTIMPTTFWDQWINKLQNDFLETQQTSVCVWGCAQTINFLFLPTHTRVLFTSFVSVFWSAYLSFIGHRDAHDDDDHDDGGGGGYNDDHDDDSNNHEKLRMEEKSRK